MNDYPVNNRVFDMKLSMIYSDSELLSTALKFEGLSISQLINSINAWSLFQIPSKFQILSKFVMSLSLKKWTVILLKQFTYVRLSKIFSQKANSTLNGWRLSIFQFPEAATAHAAIPVRHRNPLLSPRQAAVATDVCRRQHLAPKQSHPRDDWLLISPRFRAQKFVRIPRRPVPFIALFGENTVFTDWRVHETNSDGSRRRRGGSNQRLSTFHTPIGCVRRCSMSGNPTRATSHGGAAHHVCQWEDRSE
jgi:hypothetical protein